MIERSARHDAARAILFLNCRASRAALKTKGFQRAKTSVRRFAVRFREVACSILGLRQPDVTLAIALAATLTPLGALLVVAPLRPIAPSPVRERAAFSSVARAVWAYTAFIDLSLGVGNPALGLVAGKSGLGAVFLVSALAALCAAVIAMRLLPAPSCSDRTVSARGSQEIREKLERIASRSRDDRALALRRREPVPGGHRGKKDELHSGQIVAPPVTGRDVRPLHAQWRRTRLSARASEILRLVDVAMTVVTGDFGIDALRARSESFAFFHARALDCAGRDAFLHPVH